MKILFNNPYFRFFALLSLLVFTKNCTNSEVIELPKLKKISPKIEIVAYIYSIIEKDGEDLVVVDVIDYNINDNSANQNESNRIDLPNGYSILNEKVELMEKIISDSVDITMQTLNYDDYGNFKFNEKIDSDTFKQVFLNTEYERYKHIPFKITLVDNKITSITEIYMP